MIDDNDENDGGVVMGAAHLLTPYGILTCTDERVMDVCEAWLNKVQTLKPMCLLCNHEWTTKDKAICGNAQAVGGFFIVTQEGSQVATVSGVCITCMRRHGDNAQMKCFEVLAEVLPGVQLVSDQHVTVQ